jgi:hypothetical protein
VVEPVRGGGIAGIQFTIATLLGDEVVRGDRHRRGARLVQNAISQTSSACVSA